MRKPLGPDQRRRVEELVREKEERCGVCGSTGLRCEEDAATFVDGGFNVRVLCTNTGAEAHAGASAWPGTTRSPRTRREGSASARDHPPVPSRCRKMSLRTDGFQRRTSIETQAKSDGLRLLRAIDATQAHGQEGIRVDPAMAAHEAGLDVGDVGSDRYHHALEYLLEEGALVGDDHTAFDVGEEHPHGYALYFFTRRALRLLEG